MDNDDMLALSAIPAEAPPAPVAMIPISTDETIRAAIARGDQREALSLTTRHYAKAIGRLAMAFTGSQAEAEEIAQDTLLQAFDAFASYRGEGTVRSFVFTIARRVSARAVETRSRREAKLKLVDAPTDPHVMDAVSSQREAADSIRKALSELRPSEREAVLLRYLGECSFQEVAEACGCDEAAARQRVSRGLKRLREVMKDEVV